MTAWWDEVAQGTRVIYIPGNHDEMIGSFEGSYGNSSIQKRAIYRPANGYRILIMHGRELDTARAMTLPFKRPEVVDAL
jgi:UDP-2,3-diacylglucosamine pyrophosphatase LpxH